MSGTHVFGYGSLVNAGTHDLKGVEAARITGYRRVWQPSPLRRVAYLTVVAADGAEVLGAVAEVPAGGWGALDLRERAYQRRALPGHAAGGRPGVSVYAAPSVNPPNPGQPILLSYLDVVIQGFLRLHGEEGAAEFFAGTEGWQTPVLNDRAAPLYPRHQRLSAAERDAVDEGLLRIGACVLAANASAGITF